MPANLRAALPWIPAALAVAIAVAATWTSWFEHAVAVSDSSGSRVEVHTANAWAASWWWSAAVVCAVAAGGLGYRAARSDAARGVVAGSVALAFAGLGLALVQQARVTGPEDVVLRHEASVYQGEAAEPDPYAVQRGQLALLDLGGYDSRYGAGAYVGLALLTAQAAACLGTAMLGRRGQAPRS